MPEIEASFLHLFSNATVGEGGRISGELFGGVVSRQRQPLLETSDQNDNMTKMAGVTQAKALQSTLFSFLEIIATFQNLVLPIANRRDHSVFNYFPRSWVFSRSFREFLCRMSEEELEGGQIGKIAGKKNPQSPKKD